MVESKNLKLKLGLCGLALTSFLALNVRGNTVHADTADSGNANAITWDSDQDDSQVVKQDSQQSQSSQSAQTQSAVQQKQVPKVQSVQSNVQPKKQQIAVSSVFSTPVQAKRAETSIVRQSNIQTSTVNRLNIQNTRNNQDNLRIANVNATVQNAPVQITNPQNNQVIVHYVKTNGQSVSGVQDTTIDVTKLGKGQYAVPNGYQLANNNGYTNDDNVSTSQVIGSRDPGNHGHYKGALTGNTITGSLASKLTTIFSPNASGDEDLGGGRSSNIVINVGSPTGESYFLVELSAFDRGYQFATKTLINAKPSDIVSNFLKDQSEYNGSVRLTNEECAQLVNWSTNLNTQIFRGDVDAYIDDVYAEDGQYLPGPLDLKLYGNAKGYRFTDNSGQVKSVVGNHINVAVIKPVSVDPNSSDCKRQAQRVIHVAFPNGVKPKSYDSITDSAGNKLALDSNNNLTQTVTFTRAKTIDSLTGTTLNQTSWQQHGAINAVTLPAIPGYTMVTNN